MTDLSWKKHVLPTTKSLMICSHSVVFSIFKHPQFCREREKTLSSVSAFCKIPKMSARLIPETRITLMRGRKSFKLRNLLVRLSSVNRLHVFIKKTPFWLVLMSLEKNGPYQCFTHYIKFPHGEAVLRGETDWKFYAELKRIRLSQPAYQRSRITTKDLKRKKNNIWQTRHNPVRQSVRTREERRC